MAKLNKEELEQRMSDKLNAIPSICSDSVKTKKAFEKNRFEDKKNLDHTIKILKERESEALEVDDRKKKFVAMAVARDQQDQFNVRSNLSEQQQKFNFIKNSIPQDDWALLEPLVEYNEEICIDGDFSERDLHTYFRDEFHINPKYIVKLIELIKIKRKLNELEESF